MISPWMYRFNDSVDQWFAKDKLEHLGGAFILTVLVAALCGVGMAIGATIVAGILVEVVEVTSYQGWVKAGQPGATTGYWPQLTDLVSPKDLIVDGIGLVLGIFLWSLVR